MLVRLDLHGSPFLGVYAGASERHLVLSPLIDLGFASSAAEALDVPVLRLTVGGSDVLGALVSMNSRGAVVSDLILADERKVLEEAGLQVAVVAPPLNAAGNVILANDNGALVHPGFSSRARERIELALGVPVRTGLLAGLNTPGSAGVATNKGVLVHPKASSEEIAVVEEALGVKAKVCTVNHGSPYLGAGLVVNTKGALIGATTTGPEMARIEDGLGYLD